jgi:serine/threonine-protein kinase
MASSLLVGRYQLGELIGRGGMGEVWQGRDLRSGRPVAVKMLTPQVAQMVEARERFAREMRAAARVVHPNVVTVLDVGEHEGQPFLVMELLSGRSLAADLVERGRYGFVEACHLLAQAAAGLDAAHRAGVVHRDVKPANLHRTAQGVLKVVDFGVAHLATEVARLTAVGTVVGTAAYLSPEQIVGHGGQPASDLYALGCVGYELLCGHPPFVGSAPQLVYKHLHEPPVPPSRYREDVPADLEGLILALLAKDPAARPAGAGAALQILSSFTQPPARTARLTGSPVPPVLPPGGARAGDTALLNTPDGGPRRAPSEGRRLVIPAAAALTAIIAAVVGVSLLSSSGQPSAGPAPSGMSSVAPSEEPTTTPSAATSAMLTPSTLPTRSGIDGWLAEFDHALLAQQAQGGIDPGLARKVHEQITKMAGNFSEDKGRGKGKGNQAQKQMQGLVRDLFEAQRQGKLAADGPLSTFLDRSGLSDEHDN